MFIAMLLMVMFDYFLADTFTQVSTHGGFKHFTYIFSLPVLKAHKMSL